MKTPKRAAGETGSPGIRELSRDECAALLARLAVGRIAYSVHDRVGIVPIHYLVDDDWIYGRTSRGTKLEAISVNRWVAFEVDEVESTTEWQSVVVHGAMYLLSPTGAQREVEAYQRGAELMRQRDPAAWSEDDPLAHRDVMFRIHMTEVAGRASSR